MNYTREQIELIDKVFMYFFQYHCNRSTQNQPTVDNLAKICNTEDINIEFAIKEMCKICEDHALFTFSVAKYGSYHISRMDKIKCENFISHGGIIGLFDSKVKLLEESTIKANFELQKLKAETSNAIFNNKYGNKIIIGGFILALLTFGFSVLASLYFDKNQSFHLQNQVDSLRNHSEKTDSLYKNLIELIKKDSIK